MENSFILSSYFKDNISIMTGFKLLYLDDRHFYLLQWIMSRDIVLNNYL